MTEKTQKIVRGMCVLGAAVLLSGAPVQAELQSGGTLLVPGTIMGAPVTAKAEAKSVAQVNAAKEAAKTQTSSLADLASADVLEITDAPLPADIKSETAPQIISPVAQAAKPEEAKPTEEVAAAPASSIEPAAQEVKSVVPPVALGSGTVIGNPVYAKGDAKRAKPAPVAIASAEPVTPPK
jgi:cytoskeletal protein RodZ